MMKGVFKRRSLKWWLPLFVALVVAWLAYDPLYCWRVYMQTGERPPVHIKSLASGCAVITIPRIWGEYEDLDFRRSPVAEDEVLFAFRGEVAADVDQLDSKWSVRFPVLAGNPGNSLYGQREITSEEWSRGVPMPLVRFHGGAETPFREYAGRQSEILFKGKTFDKSDTYYSDFVPAVPSAGTRRLAVLSYGRPRISYGGSSLIGFPQSMGWPWRTYSVDIYDVPSGRKERHVRTWCCTVGLIDGAAWHGDSLFSARLTSEFQKTEVLICGFK